MTNLTELERVDMAIGVEECVLRQIEIHGGYTVVDEIILDALREKRERTENPNSHFDLSVPVGGDAYVIASCAEIYMRHDNDYEHGTGAVECPFEEVCSFDNCDDAQLQVFPVQVRGYMLDEFGLHTFFDDVGIDDDVNCWGNTAFKDREAAEKKLTEGSEG